MKRYIKTTRQTILSASKVGDINTFEKVMRVARKQMICCISANIYSFDAIKDTKQRSEMIERFDGDVGAYNIAMTESLDHDLISSRYNYFETFGGWVDPDTGTSTEESSFIVLGPEYDEDPVLMSNEELLDGFRTYAIELCRRYHQWAVLIIDCAEDIDNTVSGHSMEIRKELYKKFFGNKKYMTDDYESELMSDDDTQSEYTHVNNDLNSSQYDDVNLYSLHGVYYDGSGNIIKEYNNVSSGLIGEFFTSLARNQGADRFTLLASSNFYIPFIYTCQKSWRRQHSLEEIYAQRQTKFYKQHAQSLLDRM